MASRLQSNSKIQTSALDELLNSDDTEKISSQVKRNKVPVGKDQEKAQSEKN